MDDILFYEGMKIYIVEGKTSKYSYVIDWPVKAFRDEDKAKEFVLLSARPREIQQWVIDNDKVFYDYFSEVTYTYSPVELEE